MPGEEISVENSKELSIFKTRREAGAGAEV